MTVINEITNKISKLENLIVKIKVKSIPQLEQLQYSFIEKHNFLTREIDFISYLDDYYSHLNEIIKPYVF
jgi:hypothetical protein